MKDLQALLDNNYTINTNLGPGLLEMNTDDFYVTSTVFNGLTEFEKGLYRWDKDVQFLPRNTNFFWKNPFLAIFYSNTVLDRLEKIERKDDINYDYIKGSALFYRAYAYYQMAQVYCTDYRKHDPVHNNSNLGMPLRLTSNFEEKSVRSTLSDTYSQILTDLEQALLLLPKQVEFVTRPSKTAALAMLARVNLSMENYDKALTYADETLLIKKDLMDYKQVDSKSTTPFEIMNSETIFLAYNTDLWILDPESANVDSMLYMMYDDLDLRKSVFYYKKTDGSIGFKGNYAGFYNSSFFCGLAVDEIYLIKAECLARSNQLGQAKLVLKDLLDKRFSVEFLLPKAVENQDDLLTYILQERRKELVFRGLRHTDLKRLNKDERFKKLLVRKLIVEGEEKTYMLSPNDLRYEVMIPQDVIQITGMVQNP
ncbi:RagB/SusD family nutrient uptake outer membrane protein [Sphingobacterium sp. ML3W]|uniref:RagB/SusD family nutrient uptake outer membrane protein n=1 Tax=Sphingobacterium sp. ML3W TaxID=1538644 RepID=UPI001F3BBD17|nr:RagB/SusD family nutrient uptake outer membrane protein [Sphingobacterium sp. ML3W]